MARVRKPFVPRDRKLAIRGTRYGEKLLAELARECLDTLKPMAKDKRFRRRPDGVYEVCFEQNRKRKNTRREANPPQKNTSPVATELVSRGMKQKQATHR